MRDLHRNLFSTLALAINHQINTWGFWLTLVAMATVSHSSIDTGSAAHSTYTTTSAFGKFSRLNVDEWRQWAILDSLTSVATVNECAMRCMLRSACLSFHFYNSTQQCHVGTHVEYAPARDGLWPEGQIFSQPESPLYDVSTSTERFQAQFLSVSYEYQDALLQCQGRGGHLYTVKSAEKWHILTLMLLLENLVDNTPSNWLWLGLDDRQTEGDLRWVDDSSQLTPDWQDVLFDSGQPDDTLHHENCIHIYSYAHPYLNDYDCSAKMRVLCEIPHL